VLFNSAKAVACLARMQIQVYAMLILVWSHEFMSNL